MEITILGIDHGTSTGYAFVKNKEVIKYGVFLVKGQSKGERFVNFEQQLESIINELKPQIIAAERPAHKRNGTTTELLVGFYTLILKLAQKYNIKVVECYPTSVKKVVTDKGNATKQEVANVITHIYNVHLKDIVINDLRNAKQKSYEISDSLALCYYAYKQELINNVLEVVKDEF